MLSLYSPVQAICHWWRRDKCSRPPVKQQSRDEGNATVAPKNSHARGLIQETDVARAMDASGKNEDKDEDEDGVE